MCSSPFNFSTNFFIDSLSLEGDEVDDDDDDVDVASGPEKCFMK
jgi:hypothetical protein